MEITDIVCSEGQVLFTSFDEYKAQCNDIANYISDIELTEDNVKQVKATLADARKVTDALETRRKEVKKELLRPYEQFEPMIKELVSIIDNADSALRSKVREMEEEERAQRKEKLRDIWNMRIRSYSFPQYIPDAFEMWCTPQHLNKSLAMSKAEADMVQFMEDTDSDIAAIEGLPDYIDIIVEYSGTLNLSQAIATVREREEKKEQLEDDIELATFIIEGKSNINFAEMLLKSNGIEYKKK